MNQETINQMKEIWALMLENGVITDKDFTWSYYSGNFENDHPYDWKRRQKVYDDFLYQVKTQGVNWEKTSIPEYRCESEFVDSFSESKDVDVWTGTIVLNNGNNFHIGAKDIDLQYQFEQLKRKEPALAFKYFGE